MKNAVFALFICLLVMTAAAGCGRRQNQADGAGDNADKETAADSGTGSQMASGEASAGAEPESDDRETKGKENPEPEEKEKTVLEDRYPVWGERNRFEAAACQTGSSENFTYDNGVSLIEGMSGVIKDGNGKAISPYAGDIAELTKNTAALQHIDIAGGAGTTITYDLGKEYELNQALLCHFYHPTIDYSVGRYQLFMGEDPENLYTEENCIADYDNTGKWKPNVDRSGADQLFTFHQAPAGRYFGIRILLANPTDDLIRIARICLYNDEYSGQRDVFPALGVNQIDPDTGRLTGKGGSERIPLSGDFSLLCDQVTNTEDAFTYTVLSSDDYAELSFSVSDNMRYDRLALALRAPKGGRYEIYFTSGGQEIGKTKPAAVSADARLLNEEGQTTRIELLEFGERQSGGTVTVRFMGSGDWRLEEIGLYSADRRADVHMEKLVNEDFLGYGVNVLPMALMKESLSNSYKESLFELESRRITTIRPTLARIWFQIDWMEAEPGVYDYDSERMRAVYPYLDALKEAGTLVELNFGWKIGSAAAKWFSADGTTGSGGAPAPKDLEAYARSCSALIQELLSRGYDNLYAVSAYNEPNFSGEFEYGGRDKKNYYLDMMTAIREQFKKDGISDVQIWGPEESGSLEWFDYMAENGQEAFDAFTFHVYGASCDGLREQADMRLKAAGAKPALLTEFGFLGSETTWDKGNAAYALTAADAGLSGAMFWVMTGVTLADPGTYMLNDKDRHLWGPLQNGVDFVYRNYYEYGLLMRYVPAHSRVYFVENPNGDIRAACFGTPDGEMTVAVQVKEDSEERYLNLEFDRKVGKKFHKYVYNSDTVTSASALLPVCVGCVEADGALRDYLGSGYSLIVYTTMDPGKQIEMEQVKVEIEGGSAVDLKATVVGSCESPADGSEELVWSVASGGGTIDQNGHYQSEEGQRRYTTIAVKAALKSDPTVYAIALVVLT